MWKEREGGNSLHAYICTAYRSLLHIHALCNRPSLYALLLTLVASRCDVAMDNSQSLRWHICSGPVLSMAFDWEWIRYSDEGGFYGSCSTRCR